MNEKNSCTPINPKKMFMLWPKKDSYKEFDNEKKFLRLENSPPPPPITFLMVRPLYIQRIRVFLGPFFFTTLFRLNIVINQFCDFFTRNKRMNVHQEVLNVLFALLRRWWKRSYFSFMLQTHPPVFMSRNHAPSQ